MTMRPIMTAGAKVFRRPGYGILALAVAVAFLVFTIWMPNLSFITTTLTASRFSLPEKAGILWASLAALSTNFTPLSRTVTITLALLLGVDIALVVFYLRTRVRLDRAAGMGIGGVIAGLLGVGCASCGTVILSSVLGAGAAAGFLNLLPLQGQEFGFLGIALMLGGIAITARKIEQPLTCAIPKRRAVSPSHESGQNIHSE